MMDTSETTMDDASGARPDALREASALHAAFYGSPIPSPSSDASGADSAKKMRRPRNERTCMGGHRETIFGLSFSPDGRYLATASQESKICVWDVGSHRLVTTLSEGVDEKYECLRVAWMDTRRDDDGAEATPGGGERERYLLASAGADGIVRLWSASSANSNGDDSGAESLTWRTAGALDHHLLEGSQQL